MTIEERTTAAMAAPERVHGDAVIEVQGLVKRFGAHEAISNLSSSVYRGRFSDSSDPTDRGRRRSTSSAGSLRPRLAVSASSVTIPGGKPPRSAGAAEVAFRQRADRA
jgi:hypothetical protein